MEIVEEVYDMISIFVYHTRPDMKISQDLWKLYPQMLLIICGKESENGGFAVDHMTEAVQAIQNFISKDKDSL